MPELSSKLKSVVVVLASPDPHGCSQEGVKDGEKVCCVPAEAGLLAGNWQVVMRRKLRSAPLF